MQEKQEELGVRFVFTGRIWNGKEGEWRKCHTLPFDKTNQLTGLKGPDHCVPSFASDVLKRDPVASSPPQPQALQA